MIEAKVGGGSALAGATSSVANEQLAAVMAHYLQSQGIKPVTQQSNELMKAGSGLDGAATVSSPRK